MCGVTSIEQNKATWPGRMNFETSISDSKFKNGFEKQPGIIQGSICDIYRVATGEYTVKQNLLDQTK